MKKLFEKIIKKKKETFYIKEKKVKKEVYLNFKELYERTKKIGILNAIKSFEIASESDEDCCMAQYDKEALELFQKIYKKQIEKAKTKRIGIYVAVDTANGIAGVVFMDGSIHSHKQLVQCINDHFCVEIEEPALIPLEDLRKNNTYNLTVFSSDNKDEYDVFLTKVSIYK